MRLLHSIAAVIAAYFTFGLSAAVLFAISGRDPDSPPERAFALFAIAWGAAYGAFAGWLAARLAGRRPLLHAGIVAALIATVATVSWIAHPGQGAVWTQASAVFLFAPAALAGGWLRARSSRT
jgi:hypothetical protein